MGNTVTTITAARTPWSEILWDLDESTRRRFPAVASKHEYVFNILSNSVFKWLGWDANPVCFVSPKAVLSFQSLLNPGGPFLWFLPGCSSLSKLPAPDDSSSLTLTFPQLAAAFEGSYDITLANRRKKRKQTVGRASQALCWH